MAVAMVMVVATAVAIAATMAAPEVGEACRGAGFQLLVRAFRGPHAVGRILRQAKGAEVAEPRCTA